MKVAYYYRGCTGSAGFLLPEDVALLKRLFTHDSLPPKGQLYGKRCWLYLRVDTGNRNADKIAMNGQASYLRQFAEKNDMQIVGEYRDYTSGQNLQRHSLRLLAQEADSGSMDYILACNQGRIYRGNDLRGLLQYEDHLHTLGVDILYPFEQD
ncbi:recombinase family protein [Flavonifractor sp. AGMB03687]|uniref:recombinase family protein n=1 Tax=Flavonifractor sp. AGMB03687 TaxID=2785133 RepID=UPI001AE0CA22|nr:recombinase family protein [Flavonifractor sp. AGMB03687]